MSRAAGGFGLLTARTMNLGDDIQALAALQHLPGAQHVVDRDDIGSTAAPPGTPVVANGWWTNFPERLPIGDCTLDPLITSVHLARSGVLSRNGTTVLQVLDRPTTLDYLREHGPVGCRDHATAELLVARGVDARFSGCLTLTLTRSNLDPVPDPPVLVVDLPRQLRTRVRRSSDHPVVVGTNGISPRTGLRERLLAARHRLAQIERAHAVVTTRLHVALPSLALGTPVLWVVPEGSDARIDSYLPWVPHVSAAGLPGALQERSGGWPPNPSLHLGVARELTSTVQSWAGSRGPVATPQHDGADDPDLITFVRLTREVMGQWERLDRAAGDRVRRSWTAVPDRLRHRRLLVDRRGASGA